MAQAIRTEDLTKYYGPVVGVESLSLEVASGEVFGFLGANGSGKTTTIRLLLDLLRPTRGRAQILGFDCRREGLQARRLVGYLPGEMPVYPELTGAGYLRYLAQVGRRPPPAVHLEWLLRRFDLSEADLNRKLRDQSHGMKRKLGIIQALMTDAPLLVLDEPTSGLDPLMIEAFSEVIHHLKRSGRTTVFLSSHVLSEVEKMCDRFGLIRRGRLVTVRTLEEIRRDFPKRVVVEFAEEVNGHLPAIAGARLVERHPRQWVFEVHGPLGSLVARLAGLPVADLHVETLKLEDYVLKLYREEDGTRKTDDRQQGGA